MAGLGMLESPRNRPASPAPRGSAVRESGIDFIQRLVQEIYGMQDSIRDLKSEIQREREERATEVQKVSEEYERKLQNLRQEHVELRCNVRDQESEVKRSFAAVAEEHDAFKARLNGLQDTLAHQAEEASALALRVTACERDLPTKASQAEHRALVQRVGEMDAELATKATIVDLRATTAKTADVEAEVGVQASKTERNFQGVHQVLQAAQADIERRSTIVDMRAVEARQSAGEAAAEQMRGEICTKASRAELREAEQHLESVSAELDKTKACLRAESEATGTRFNQVERNMDTRALKADLEALSAITSELDRIARSTVQDLTQTNRDLLTKAPLTDAQALIQRVSGIEGTIQAIDRALERKGDIEQHIRPLKMKADQLDQQLALKADQTCLRGALQGLDDAMKRSECLTRRAEDLEGSLAMKAHKQDLEKTSARLASLEVENAGKASRGDVEALAGNIWASVQPLEKQFGPLQRRVDVGEMRSEETWKRLEGRLEDLTHRKAEQSHLQDLQLQVQRKADVDHIHDRIVSNDGRTTFAI